MAEQGGVLRIDAVLARAALSEPGREALVYCGKSWTYAEAYDRTCRLAGALASLGVGKGERVAFWAENRPGGGAVFRFTLPIEGTPPALPPREVAAESA